MGLGGWNGCAESGGLTTCLHFPQTVTGGAGGGAVGGAEAGPLLDRCCVLAGLPPWWSRAWSPQGPLGSLGWEETLEDSFLRSILGSFALRVEFLLILSDQPPRPLFGNIEHVFSGERVPLVRALTCTMIFIHPPM